MVTREYSRELWHTQRMAFAVRGTAASTALACAGSPECEYIQVSRVNIDHNAKDKAFVRHMLNRLKGASPSMASANRISVAWSMCQCKMERVVNSPPEATARLHPPTPAAPAVA